MKKKVLFLALVCIMSTSGFATEMNSNSDKSVTEPTTGEKILQKSGFNKVKKTVKETDFKQKSGYNKAKKKVEEMEGPNIETVSGDTTFIANKATACIVLDWSEAQWDKKKPVKEQWKDEYDKYVTEGEKFLKKGFSEKSKKITLTDDCSKATLVYTIKLTNFDYYFSAMSWVPGHKHKVWASVTVTEKATGKVLYEGKVKKFEGGRDFNHFDSYTECMEDFGKVVAKMK